ncbi:hypothetical protein BMS3Bbin03_01530 [bacterium BMS3Bbin03]|nr:hypothetical protein BMS3Bbin03_01530 [bacterium BMS3Bbin03]
MHTFLLPCLLITCCIVFEAFLEIFLKALENQAIDNDLRKDRERYCRNGHESHSLIFRTSFGTVSYSFAQLLNRQTNRSFFPLRKIFSIEPYKHCQWESLRSAINLAIHMSYQKATTESNTILPAGFSKVTFWRSLHLFAREAGHWSDFKKAPYRFLMVDSTKVTLIDSQKRSLGKGLILWLQTLIKKIFFPNAWDKLWNQFLEINQLMKLIFLKASYQWL